MYKIICFVLISFNLSAQIVYSEQMTLMGSVFDITVVESDLIKAKGHVKACVEEIERIENLISEWRPFTEISKVNKNAGIAPVKVSKEVLDLTQRALKYSEMTNGAFDISIVALDKVWYFDGSMSTLPSKESIQNSIKNVGYQHVKIDTLASTIFLERKGMKIGFGSIGKGYAADKGRELLQKRNVSGGIVNASGDLSSWGKPPKEKYWKIGVTNPYKKREVYKVLKLNLGSVATSGNYEKYVEFNGKRYSHIINPKTGWPSRGLTSVTVVGPSAEFANALSTSAMVLGKKEGKKLLKKHKAYSYFWIKDKKRELKKLPF